MSINNIVIVSLLGLLVSSCVQSPPARENQHFEPISSANFSADDKIILQQLLANMVAIPAGNFTMGDTLGVGDSEELPLRKVHVKAFALGRFEVTFEQYDLYARMTGNDAPRDRWGRGERPVIDVDWYDAIDFTHWVSAATGIVLRLPSEAEWEYAARAGGDQRYGFGDDIAQLCVYGNVADSDTDIGWRTKLCSDGYKTTAPVGSFKPNGFGVFDMHGNVWEWLSDCWSSNYRRAAIDSLPRVGGDNCSTRVQRGGSWFYGADEARSSARSSGEEFDKSVTLGFRLAGDV